MAELKKIEERTLQFIEAHAQLKGANKMVTHEELAKIIGVESKTTISEILKKRQNIQPDQWKSFKDYFKISTGYSVQPDTISRMSANEDPVEYGRELPKGDLIVTLKDYVTLLIETKNKAEQRERRLLALLEKDMSMLKTNSETILADLQQVAQMTRADDLTMMDSQDRIEGREVGTSSTEASIVEHAFSQEGAEDDTTDSNDKQDSSGREKRKRTT